MKEALAVMLGGALGSLLRYGITQGTARLWGEAFPWGTLAVNVAGSAAIGFLAGLTLGGNPLGLPETWRLFLVVGVLGGFTTFSAYSIQTLSLLQEGALAAALLYAGGSVVLALAAVWIGHSAASFVRG